MPNIYLLECAIDVARECQTRGYQLDMGCWHCGTRACLGGWLASHAFFRQKGLTAYTPAQANHRQGQIMLRRFKNGQPIYLQGFDALQKLFELDDYQTNYLFADNPHCTGVDKVETWDEVIYRLKEVLHGGV